MSTTVLDLLAMRIADAPPHAVERLEGLVLDACRARRSYYAHLVEVRARLLVSTGHASLTLYRAWSRAEIARRGTPWGSPGSDLELLYDLDAALELYELGYAEFSELSAEARELADRACEEAEAEAAAEYERDRYYVGLTDADAARLLN